MKLDQHTSANAHFGLGLRSRFVPHISEGEHPIRSCWQKGLNVFLLLSGEVPQCVRRSLIMSFSAFGTVLGCAGFGHHCFAPLGVSGLFTD